MGGCGVVESTEICVAVLRGRTRDATSPHARGVVEMPMRCITDFDVTYGSALAPAVSVEWPLLLLRMPRNPTQRVVRAMNACCLLLAAYSSLCCKVSYVSYAQQQQSHAARLNPSSVKFDIGLDCY